MSEPVTHPIIELRGAGVRFGTTQALQHVSLAVRAGERVALIGANGSGKSTLLRVLHGLQPLQAGERRALPLRMGMLFQRPYLLRMSVAANLRVAAWLGRVPPDERASRIEQVLAQAGVADLARRNGRALSLGQQQRVALARACLLEPQVLLLDEPTASLDPHGKRDVEALIEQVALGGTTVLMSSHNLGQVKRLATRVVYLEHGRVLADAPVDEFFRDGGAPAAAAFLRGELSW